MKVRLFTDPGCPFGFCAQRQELQLQWHFGHAIDELALTMIVLSEHRRSFGETGMTADTIARGRARLAAQHDMPLLAEPPPVRHATLPACRLYVAARLHAPEAAYAVLRSLRRQAHSEGHLLDDPETLERAVLDAGLEPAVLAAWADDGAVEEAVRADMAATRDPLPEAHAMDHRLSGARDARRYSTSSAIFEHDGRRVVAAGFQPFAVYEVAMANAAPGIERRPGPDDASEVLAWAPFPLATAEIAELRGVSIDEARAELDAAGASFAPVANDGYWSA